MLKKVKQNTNYMRLDRMGSRYPSRLSFSRSMLRRMIYEKWKLQKVKFDLDNEGYGTAVYEITIEKSIYSLVCLTFSLAAYTLSATIKILECCS